MKPSVAIMASPVFQQVQELHGEDRTVWGGAERYLLDLCRLFNSMGWDVEIFQQLLPKMENGRPVLPRQHLMKSWRGFPVRCMPVMENGAERYGAFPTYNAYFNELAGAATLRIYFVTSMCWPQVVHPAISVSHGIYWDYPTGGIYGTADVRIETMARMREMFMAADVCVAVDHNVKNVVRAMFTGAENRITVIPNYVDTKLFTPGPYPPPGKPQVLFPRRFTSVRGCNHFIEASTEVPEATFVACGQADSVGSEAAIGTIPTIRYTWVEPEKMPELYREATVAVVPTKGAEGLSLSLLEAMASGVPLVTTMNGGLGEAVIPGYNALVYDPDHGGCVDEIRELLGDGLLRKRLAKRSLEVAQVFDKTVWEARWTRVISEVSGWAQ